MEQRTETENSKFEELIGDTEALFIMLEGALKDWNATFDIWLVDKKRYLFNSIDHPKFRPFCHALRKGSKIADDYCRACDHAFTDKVAKNPKDNEQFYYCHVGLVDTAVPILINNVHLATVFFGQARPDDVKKDNEHFSHVRRIERQLGFKAGDLEALAHETPQISRADFEEARKRVARVVHYITRMGYERQQLRQTSRRDNQRKIATDALENASTKLIELSKNSRTFWQKAGEVLHVVGEALRSPCGMILIPHRDGLLLEVKAVAGLSLDDFKIRRYQFYDPVLKRVLNIGKPDKAPLNQFNEADTISGSIQNASPVLAKSVNIARLARIPLGNERFGILLLCFDSQLESEADLSSDEVEGIMTQISVLVGTAYHNSTMYFETSQELKSRMTWMEQVTHQIIAPLNSVRGHAENASNRLRDLVTSLSQIAEPWKIDRLESSFESIRWNAQYASRLANNLAWVVYRKENESLVFERVKNIQKLLIYCARNLSGIARSRGFRRVWVEPSMLSTLDNELCINENSFRQAIENLIDNAVKYGNPGSDITIEGGLENGRGIIRVINEGIQLRLEDCDRIFEYGFRTDEARSYDAPGTGIGLFVARQIIRTHNGLLTASPSVGSGDNRWRTTFTIALPISDECNSGD